MLTLVLAPVVNSSVVVLMIGHNSLDGLAFICNINGGMSAQPALIEPAAAAPEASAAYGVGLPVLHVENDLIKIFNLRCDTSVAASK